MAYKKHVPYNALVVTPEGSRRAHLKMAIHHDQKMGGNTFASVHSAASLTDAIAKLRTVPDYDIVLISDSYEKTSVADFVSTLKQTCPQRFGIVYVLRQAVQERTDVADYLLGGVDSCLCEPFSVETLREITELAARVRKENSERKIISASGLILDAALDEIERRAQQLRGGGRSGGFAKKVVEASQMFRELSEERRELFFSTLTEKAEKRPPYQPPATSRSKTQNAKSQTDYSGPSEIIRRRKEREKRGKD